MRRRWLGPHTLLTRRSLHESLTRLAWSANTPVNSTCWHSVSPLSHKTFLNRRVSKRVESFLPELFVFVTIPGVRAHNNLAERRVRPLVIARKISGGSPSPKGSATRLGLASLFGTWMAQGLNPFAHCLTFLTQAHSFV